MTAVPENEYYLLGRNSVETQRLDEQHNFLTDLCGGSLISKSISEDKIFSIADVATGTGVWLRDVKAHLDSTHPTGPSKPRYYHGFDLSDAQYPTNQGLDGINYSLHDCLKPFPVEHHNRYDLVHVRLLVAAIKETEFKLIVANLKPLLKRGGYLQWEDLDLKSFLTSHEPKYDSFPTIQTLRLCIETQIGYDASPHVPETVADAARENGFADVIHILYNTKDRPEMAEQVLNWVSKVMAPLLRAILGRTGRAKNEEDLQAHTQSHLDGLRTSFERGLAPNGAMGMVIARKE
ncbi:putative LaeA-like methyltransferase [Talaromyces proteolyticus]|uniref:LaeA-like methyltransferase n=1 Tax=Talaromyces proteolyticus TaxID=1131652 RepID=A0AAD4L6V8_9EURO|nr:putative LaeA-like methyltransferase [Talaromyces proteolyticus]KAH8705049.1 putative LaeA-like methyltransferase [Talaromyces proteolyticus]